MPNLALITGASSGIGRELARYHAARGGDLIISARREAELLTLKAELEAAHGVSVHTIALDLGVKGSADTLYAETQKIGGPIDVLINNAGFGGHGPFITRDLDTDLAMIDLNVKALVTLSHHIGKDMAARGAGKMLHVSSIASYIPGPMQSVYFATKAFVSSFSQAIDEELRASGVTSTALEPGAVATGFIATAGLENTSLGATAGATPESVAKFGYDAMLAGKLRAINTPSRRFQLHWVIPWLPYRAVLKMVKRAQAEI